MHTTRRNVYPKNVSVIKMQHTSELKDVGKQISFTEFHTLSFRVSILITSFIQKGIHEWEKKSSDSFLNCRLKPCDKGPRPCRYTFIPLFTCLTS